MAIIRNKKFEAKPKPKAQPRSRRRLRLLLTRDLLGDQHIVLWVGGAEVRMDNHGNYCAARPQATDDLVPLPVSLCRAMLGSVPKPGQKLGVKLVQHRWHN